MINNCRKCEVELSDLNWFPSLKLRGSRLCKSCSISKSSAFRRANLWRSQLYSREYYKRNPKYNVAWGRQNRLDVRSEMIASYGGACVHCGITNPIVLDIDHIDNNGGSHRKAGMWGWRLYRWLRKNNYPKDNYQLLCRNCNWIKEMDRRRGKVAYQILKGIAEIA